MTVPSLASFLVFGSRSCEESCERSESRHVVRGRMATLARFGQPTRTFSLDDVPLAAQVQCFKFAIIPCLSVFTLEELVLNICSSTACWCGSSVELVHSLSRLLRMLAPTPRPRSQPPSRGLQHARWSMRTRVASEGARLANTSVHHIELVCCLRLGSSVPEEVARRESSNASSYPGRCVSFGTLHITFHTLRSHCRLLEDLVHRPTHCPSSRRPLILRYRLRILHLRSLKPYCVRNRNQPGLSARTRWAQATRTQLNHSSIDTQQKHTGEAHRVYHARSG